MWNGDMDFIYLVLEIGLGNFGESPTEVEEDERETWVEIFMEFVF